MAALPPNAAFSVMTQSDIGSSNLTISCHATARKLRHIITFCRIPISIQIVIPDNSAVHNRNNSRSTSAGIWGGGDISQKGEQLLVTQCYR
jgi:hypothetical protein